LSRKRSNCASGRRYVPACSLSTEQDFTAEKIITDDNPADEAMPEYTEFIDPKFNEQIMAESLMGEEPTVRAED